MGSSTSSGQTPSPEIAVSHVANPQFTLPPQPSLPVWLNPVLSGLTLTFVLGAVYNFALWRGGVDANLKTLQDGQGKQEEKLENISHQLEDLKVQVVYLRAAVAPESIRAEIKVPRTNAPAKP